jgi:hypothetical protein
VSPRLRLQPQRESPEWSRNSGASSCRPGVGGKDPVRWTMSAVKKQVPQLALRRSAAKRIPSRSLSLRLNLGFGLWASASMSSMASDGVDCSHAVVGRAVLNVRRLATGCLFGVVVVDHLLPVDHNQRHRPRRRRDRRGERALARGN